MIGSHTRLGGESVVRAHARLVPARDGTHPFAKKSPGSVVQHTASHSSYSITLASFTSFFLTLFVFVFGN